MFMNEKFCTTAVFCPIPEINRYTEYLPIYKYNKYTYKYNYLVNNNNVRSTLYVL